MTETAERRTRARRRPGPRALPVLGLRRPVALHRAHAAQPAGRRAAGERPSVAVVQHLRSRTAPSNCCPRSSLGYALPVRAPLAAVPLSQYGRPFWRSLGWVDPPGLRPAHRCCSACCWPSPSPLASVVLQTPDIDSPMKEFLTRATRPSCCWRCSAPRSGRSARNWPSAASCSRCSCAALGAVPGMLLAAVPFGLLHLQQYAWSWRHGLLITLAGAAFGWMRQAPAPRARLY